MLYFLIALVWFLSIVWPAIKRWQRSRQKWTLHPVVQVSTSEQGCMGLVARKGCEQVSIPVKAGSKYTLIRIADPERDQRMADYRAYAREVVAAMNVNEKLVNSK